VVQLHIPSAGKLTEEAVCESIAQMRILLKKYYPDYPYKAFACGSWLLNPVMADLLGEESNIVKFGKRFQPMTIKTHGTGVFYFAFLQPDRNCNIASLPENNRFEKVVKEYYLSGKVIHEVAGYFL